jgi:hypothetical protein
VLDARFGQLLGKRTVGVEERIPGAASDPEQADLPESLITLPTSAMRSSARSVIALADD